MRKGDIMKEQIIMGLVAGAGALAYNLWGLFKAIQEAKFTPANEVWDWQLTVSSIVPSVAVAFLAGYNMTPSSAGDFVALFMAGFGAASAQNKAGLKNFFR